MRVLVAGWVGSTNLGDELVFAGLRRLLAERDVEVEVISQNAAATSAVHGVPAVAAGNLPGILAAAGRADAMVFGGGGLLQDVTSPLNLPYHLARIAAARARRIPVAAVGLGVGGLDTRLGHVLTRRGMAASVGISVRDVASQQLLTRIGVPGARLTADLAFALAPGASGVPTAPGAPRAPTASVAAAGREAGRIVVCLRPWGGGNRLLPAGARGDTTPGPYVEVLARALDRIAADTGRTVRFVALQADRDDAFHARIARAMTHPTERVSPDLDALLGEVAAAHAVISMRYHGGIAAVLAGLPVVMIDYALKGASLAGELGDASRLLAWDPGALAGLPEAYAAVASRHDDVGAVRDRLVARQAGNGDLLDELLAAAVR